MLLLPQLVYSDFLTGETSPLWALAVAIQLVSLRTSDGPQWQPGSLALRCNFWLLTLHTGLPVHGAGMELRTLHMLGKSSVTKPQPQPLLFSYPSS